MTAPVLEFDADLHRYTIGGRRLPSVTEVINAVLPRREVDPWYLVRGTATHLGCELLDKRTLDWATVDPAILPRIVAYEAFRAAYPAEIVAMEKPLHHPVFMYAGRVDRIFRREGKLIVGDMKNGVSAHALIQLGFYSLLWFAATGQKVHKGVVIELCDNETFKAKWLEQSELKRAEQEALAVLTVYGFMTKHNLLPKGQR